MVKETGKIIALSKSASHTLIKGNENELKLLKGLGVEGDAHMGVTVKHRSRVKQDPTQPNLRQVHLIHKELHEELSKKGFSISPGQMGENITTSGIDLLNLPENTILKIRSSEIQITGLRNPCIQLNSLQPGLMQAVIDKDQNGALIRKAGVMAIVLKGGKVFVGDGIEVIYPNRPFIKLDKV